MFKSSCLFLKTENMPPIFVESCLFLPTDLALHYRQKKEYHAKSTSSDSSFGGREMAGYYIHKISEESGRNYILHHDEDVNKLFVLLFLEDNFRVNFNAECYVPASQILDLSKDSFEFIYFNHVFVLRFEPKHRIVSLLSVAYVWTESVKYENLEFTIGPQTVAPSMGSLANGNALHSQLTCRFGNVLLRSAERGQPPTYAD